MENGFLSQRHTMPAGYTVRESRKAKHVSLRLSISGSLEVVVPPGFDPGQIPAIVQKKQGWIDRTRQRMQAQQATVGLVAGVLPEQIRLQSIAETWQVEYCPTQRLGVKAVGKPQGQLMLYGSVHDHAACQLVLQQWIAHKAQVHLIPWLRKVSRELHLPFESVRIRRQKTLWGSCSARKTISLNSKLLFLSPQLVRYVFIHELCHTKHLNHSANFWQLVGQFEPSYRELDRQLRDSRFCIPPWMEL